MGEDERNDSLFIFDEHKNSYIPVTRNQIFMEYRKKRFHLD